MDDCIDEIEAYLDRLDQLNNHAENLLQEYKKAESAGQIETCRICNRRRQVVRQMAKFLNDQIDKQIMFRLPPMPNKSVYRESLLKI